MLTRLFTIISLLVFITLLAMGSTLVPAFIKSTTVFFCLTIGYAICRYLVTIIQENTSSQEAEPSTGQNVTG